MTFTRRWRRRRTGVLFSYLIAHSPLHIRPVVIVMETCEGTKVDGLLSRGPIKYMYMLVAELPESKVHCRHLLAADPKINNAGEEKSC